MVLQTHMIQPVEFDINDREHIKAFVALTQFNRQHPTLRFTVNPPYNDVRTMMSAKVCEMFSQQSGVFDEVKEMLNVE